MSHDSGDSRSSSPLSEEADESFRNIPVTYPNLTSKMASSASEKQAESSFKTPKTWKAHQISYSEVIKLTGSENYNNWAEEVKTLLYTQGLHDIVINEAKTSSTDEKVLYVFN